MSLFDFASKMIELRFPACKKKGGGDQETNVIGIHDWLRLTTLHHVDIGPDEWICSLVTVPIGSCPSGE